MNVLTAITSDIYRLEIPFLDIYTTVFLINTPEGYILYDTGTYPEDIDNYVVPAMDTLGISADALKYVVISHNHRDHAGGLNRFNQLFPGTLVAAGSTDCAERIPGCPVRVLEDAETILEPLQAVLLPGHTKDCVGIWDPRTNTLLSGDSLQVYGIYGSGNWGCNISYIPEHLELCRQLLERHFDRIVSCHDYHPCGYLAEGPEQVKRYIDGCSDALLAVRAFIRQHPGFDAEQLADMYNGNSGLPTVGAHVFKKMLTLQD